MVFYGIVSLAFQEIEKCHHRFVYECLYVMSVVNVLVIFRSAREEKKREGGDLLNLEK